MADRTGIEWADATWNPIRGCTRVSEGCRNCYAEVLAARFSGVGQPYYGIATRTPSGPRWTGELQLVPHALDQPLRWHRPRRIFVNSMSDLFHKRVPDDWIDTVFGIMALAPQHTYLVLTKRPDRMHEWMHQTRARPAIVARAQPAIVECVSSAYDDCPEIATRWPLDARRMLELAFTTWPLPHVWLGVSVENQEAANARIPWLLNTPAAKRFLSCEPLLGPVDLHSDACSSIDWVIAGGESGRHARPLHPDWARGLRDQCRDENIPFFFKQWGEFHPEDQPDDVPGEDWSKTAPYPDGTTALRVGKHRAGNRLDGRHHLEFPA